MLKKKAEAKAQRKKEEMEKKQAQKLS